METAVQKNEKTVQTNDTAMQQMEIEKETQKGYLAVAFMLGSDKARFGCRLRTWRMTISKAKIITQHPSLQPIICLLIGNKTPTISYVQVDQSAMEYHLPM